MNVGDKVKIKEWAVDEGVVGKYFGKMKKRKCPDIFYVRTFPYFYGFR